MRAICTLLLAVSALPAQFRNADSRADPNPFAGQPDAISAGRKLFAASCSGCHGANASVHAPDLTGVFGKPVPLSDGTIVIADERRSLGILFGRTADGRGVRRGTGRVTLAAIGVLGVPDIALEEALWVAGSALHA